jgi:pimeloyl-ACP methyl ester carboxylesterase
MTLLVIFAILVVGAYWFTYPKLGHYVYHYGNYLEAKYYGFTKQTITIDEIQYKICTTANKNKPMLLLIHGFSASHAVWLRYAKYLADDYYVVIPDLAGHGETGYQRNWDYSIDSQSKRLTQLIAKLGATKAHLVGNSMGGYIAAHMASYYPDYCSSITLIDPAGLVSPKPSKMDSLIAEGRNPFFIYSDADFIQFYKMTMARPPFLPNLVKMALKQHYQSRRDELEKIFMDYTHQYNYLHSKISAVECPSMLIWGAKDELIDVSSASLWSDSLNCVQHIWHDLGHMPMLEAPERTAWASIEFLVQQKASMLRNAADKDNISSGD